MSATPFFIFVFNINLKSVIKIRMAEQDKTLYFGKAYLPKSFKTNTMDSLNLFLEKEKQNNLQDNWSKLNKTVKLQKLIDYAEKYATENMLSDDEKAAFQTFLKEALDKKKLNRVKDVSYDRQTGTINQIVGLTYHRSVKRFSLKSTEVVLDSTRKQCVQNI